MDSLDLKTTFNSNVERYHAMRPNYPLKLFNKLIADTCLPNHANLLEIGPGTGQATKPLAKRGYNITAVELGDDLAAKARRVLKGYPNVKIVSGAFEDTKLPKNHFDLIYSATAIHWIKPKFRFAKPHQLLKKDGYLAIIHTEHVSDETGDKLFFAGQPIYQKYFAKDKPINKRGDFAPPQLKNLQPPENIDKNLFLFKSFTAFPMAVTYSSDEYTELLATYSPQLALPQTNRTAFLKEIKQLIDQDFGGQVTKHYGMTLTICQNILL